MRLTSLRGELNADFNCCPLQVPRCSIGLGSMRMLAAALKSSLVVLDLTSNHIRDGVARYLTQLTRLQQLCVSENGITSTGAASIGKITTLRHLDLSDNLITAEGCACLTSLCSLQVLNLAGNQVWSNAIQHLTCLRSSLQELDISDNIRGDPHVLASALGQMTGLTSLWGSAGAYGGLVATTVLSTLTKLQRLGLALYVQLDSGLVCPLIGLSALTALTSLSGVVVNGGTSQALKHFTALQELGIRLGEGLD